MPTLYGKTGYNEIVSRIEKLTPDSQRLWGKMSVAQMMAHCAGGLQMALGDTKPKGSFIGLLVGRFFKPMLTGEKKMGKNSPTTPLLKITDEREFSKEKDNFMALLKRMNEGGEASATTHPHAFFGKLTPDEWGQGQYHHLDHHLRQFGV